MSLEVGYPLDPSRLLADGPQVTVSIGRHLGFKERPQALIDTGADGCHIDQELITRLGLEKVDRVTVRNVEKPMIVDVFEAAIAIEGLDIETPRRFSAYPIAAMGGNFRVILGRDVLAAMRLEYTGPTGRVTLANMMLVASSLARN